MFAKQLVEIVSKGGNTTTMDMLRHVIGALHTHRYGSLGAAMAGCNEQGSACEAVASVPPLSGGGSGCVFVLFGSDMAGASGFGGGGAGDQCTGAYRKQRGWCMEPRIWGR